MTTSSITTTKTKIEKASVKVIINDVLFALMAFFTVFMFNFMSLQIANILFLFFLLFNLNLKIDSSKILLALLFHLLICLISTLIYAVEFVGTSSRIIIQFAFSIEYIIWSFRFDMNKFGNYLFYAVVAESIFIIILFFALNMQQYGLYFLNIRMWGEILPGWPNALALPMIFGFFISCKQRKKWFLKLLILVAAILTTSRSAIMGCGLIFIYYSAKAIYGKFKNKFAVFIIILGIIASAVIVVVLYDPKLFLRLLYAEDRMYIINIAFELFKQRPLFGWGSSTLAQMSDPQIAAFQHTHNWITELLVRYGVLGFITFTIVLYYIFRLLKGDNRIMFVIFVILSLFQVYMRTFTSMLMVLYLINSSMIQCPKARKRRYYIK